MGRGRLRRNAPGAHASVRRGLAPCRLSGVRVRPTWSVPRCRVCGGKRVRFGWAARAAFGAARAPRPHTRHRRRQHLGTRVLARVGRALPCVHQRHAAWRRVRWRAGAGAVASTLDDATRRLVRSGRGRDGHYGDGQRRPRRLLHVPLAGQLPGGTLRQTFVIDPTGAIRWIEKTIEGPLAVGNFNLDNHPTRVRRELYEIRNLDGWEV